MLPVVLTSTLAEATTGILSFFLVNDLAQGIPLDLIETLTLTYYDVATKQIVNARQAQDVKNANDVTLVTQTTPPIVTTVTWTLQPADTVILDDAWPIEPHAAVFRWTWDSGTRHGAYAMQFGIENVAEAPVVA